MLSIWFEQYQPQLQIKITLVERTMPAWIYYRTFWKNLRRRKKKIKTQFDNPHHRGSQSTQHVLACWPLRLCSMQCPIWNPLSYLPHIQTLAILQSTGQPPPPPPNPPWFLQQRSLFPKSQYHYLKMIFLHSVIYKSYLSCYWENSSRNNCKGHNLCLCYFIGTISYIN